MKPDAQKKVRRRQDEKRMKARARRIILCWRGRERAPISPREIGWIASTHGRPCSCWWCCKRKSGIHVVPPSERGYDLKDWED